MQKRIGINDDPLNHDVHQRSRIISDMQDASISQVRIPFHVEHMHPKPGEFNFGEMDDAMRRYADAGIDAFVSIHGTQLWNSTAPADAKNRHAYRPIDTNQVFTFVSTACKRYKNITHIAYGNEINTSPFWMPNPDPEDYKWIAQGVRDTLNNDSALRHIKLGVQFAYQGLIVKADGTTGGSYPERLVDNGGMALFDFVDIHPYVNKESEQDAVYDDAARTVEYLRKHGVRQVFAGEFGISTYAGPEDFQPIITEQQQADYFRIAIPRLLALGFDRIYPFCISEFVNHSARENGYGMICKNGRRKPAYYAVKDEIQRMMGM